jgi:hypothetical protein
MGSSVQSLYSCNRIIGQSFRSKGNNSRKTNKTVAAITVKAIVVAARVIAVRVTARTPAVASATAFLPEF